MIILYRNREPSTIVPLEIKLLSNINSNYISDSAMLISSPNWVDMLGDHSLAHKCVPEGVVHLWRTWVYFIIETN